LTSLTNPFGEVTTFQYDANSRLIRKNLANGTYTTYSYNSRGFLTGIYNYKSNGTLLTYATYTYDAVGNRLSMSTPEGNYSYSYDAIYRLTGEVNPVGGTYSYTYDAVGNRLSMTHNGQTINYVYDAGNKLLQAGNTTFTYDGNGNMVSKTENGQTTTYVYNYEDKMIQVNLPNGSSIVYSYDHSGKRIAKTAGGTTIDYYFDGDDLIAEAQGASILAYYTQGQGLISQRRNNASYFYHYDGLGSTKALTDANQNIPNTTKYDAWGNILQAFGTITNPYLYVGELGYYGDGDAGMYLLTQRWYNPVVGRFVVRDPISRAAKAKWINRTPGTLASYIYGANNPSYSVDPTGLTSIKECLEAWNQCMKDAREEYERCACYFKGTQASPELLTLGCATLCAIPCSMLKGPAAGACVVWCTAICKPILQIGGDWAAAKIASLFLGICNDIYNQLTESCHIAFWFCRERVYGR
jgi:RHS repeat-associated protein